MADDSESDSKKADDVVLVHGVTDDGKGLRALRKRGEAVHACDIRKLESGKPIHGDVVSLKRRDESPLMYDVEVQHGDSRPAPATALEHAGPARVGNPKYRNGWDRIFGAPAADEKALPN